MQKGGKVKGSHNGFKRKQYDGFKIEYYHSTLFIEWKSEIDYQQWYKIIRNNMCQHFDRHFILARETEFSMSKQKYQLALANVYKLDITEAFEMASDWFSKISRIS